MDKKIFRTNFSQSEIMEAITHFIKLKKKGNLNEIYNDIFDIRDNLSEDICWYCKRKKKITKSNYMYGYFCSNICDEIFYGNVLNLFNFVDKPKVEMIPIEFVLNKQDVYDIIEDVKETTFRLKDKFESEQDNLSVRGYFYYDKKDYFLQIELINNEFIVLFKKNIKIKLINNNPLCLNCNDKIENNNFFINLNNNQINFCSILCKGTCTKLLERYFTFEENINIYIPPLIFFKDTSTVINLIKLIKDINYVIGGIDKFDKNTIHIIIFSN